MMTISESEAVDKEEKIKKLYEGIRQLKSEDRAIILLYLEKKSYEEIVEITGLTLSNVGVKINRIKKRLFRILKNSSDE